MPDDKPSIRVGVHRNGQSFCRADLSDRGITATVEGVGDDADLAIEDFMLRLRVLSDLAGDAADAMQAE